MKEMVARDAKNRFGHLIDAVQGAPVRVTKNGFWTSVNVAQMDSKRR